MLSLKKLLTKILETLVTASATGTIGTATAVKNADRQYCFLKKTGKQVRCYMGIGYNNATTQLGSSDTLFTVPSGYRPKVQAQVPGVIYRATGVTVIANIRIATDGTITQTSYQNATMVYMVAEWETA
jgi:hypothetical protein